MKKIILLLILFLAFIWIYIYKNESGIREAPTHEQPLQYYEDKDKGIKAVFIDKDSKIEIFYDPKISKSVFETSQINKFRFAINGGFFTEDNTHAGLLVLNSRKEVQIAPKDTQLTHIVDLTTPKINFYQALDYSLEGRNVETAFQTGPLILDSGVIQNEFIENSLNGEGDYLRSVLGQTESGEKFFLVSSNKIDLKTLAREIKNIPRLQNKKITAVNLDGGSSVSLYINDNVDDSYATFKKLPVLLYVTGNL